MHLVNGRSHDEATKEAIESPGQGDVGMMQLDHGEHERLVNDQFGQVHAEQDNDGGAEQG